MLIRVMNVSKSYGQLAVLDNLTVAFPANTITCILGPSGVGKTTLLNILGGLITPEAGEVKGLGQESISYLFQEHRLLPWKTVQGNLDFVLQSPYPNGEQRLAVINRFLQVVNLSEFASFLPAQLSGGMKQRVAVARAFAFPSRVLLMDEPFKALDLYLKYDLMRAFLRLWEEDQRTVVCVTHDIDEALFLAHHIHVLGGNPAKVCQSYTIPTPHVERDVDPVLRQELLKLIISGK